MNRSVYILLFIVGLFAWQQWDNRPIRHQPGVLVPEVPVQSPGEKTAAFTIDDYLVKPQAAFTIRARVLSRERYWLGTEADLSPIDLALGWREMSDQQYLDQIHIRQSGRWYFTRYDLPAPLSGQQIIHNSSNMHMIPADKYVRTRLLDLREGALVTLKGQLVNIEHPSGFKWFTSMSREDTGNGACEIVYVEQVFIE